MIVFDTTSFMSRDSPYCDKSVDDLQSTKFWRSYGNGFIGHGHNNMIIHPQDGFSVSR